MNVSENAEKLISMISKNGFKAYAVGGCVRDYFLGISGGDVDIASSAKPNELVSVLKKNNIKFAETGIKHGTVTAFLDNIPFEITTFREDGNYIDNRRPEKVYFVGSIEDDLSRRDFTVNAMAFNKETGLIDLFGGNRDIDNKIIRAVGNPDLRF
ncbi:MAG: hypothetical protein LIO43_03735, partial [Clostridiales bacterium]|nr:hypothetical protein [Clostridiales bacterium]